LVLSFLFVIVKIQTRTAIAAKEKETFGLAMTQVKMEGLGNWDKKLKSKMIAEANRFERMFPNL
jgi:hypothetical protein